MSKTSDLYGALETGGTKMVCAVITEKGEIVNITSIPTTTPQETLPPILEYFKKYSLKAIGIGSFGPIDINPKSPTYGAILPCPKPLWTGVNFVELLKPWNIPITIDTDVNASCWGEITFGAAKGWNTVVYYTIGTGIGVGIYAEGKMIHGAMHPEGGHVPVRKHPKDSQFKCICNFHDFCFEGLACGPSIEKRYGVSAKFLKNTKENEDKWEIEVDYIAQAILGIIYTVQPNRIILGGGVMHHDFLYPLIRKRVKELNNNYVNTKELNDIDNYIIPASLKDNQGVLGCTKWAIDAYHSQMKK